MWVFDGCTSSRGARALTSQCSQGHQALCGSSGAHCVKQCLAQVGICYEAAAWTKCSRADAIACARARSRPRAACIAICFTMWSTQNIENFKLYRRPHQNIHLIFLFDTAVIMIPRRDTKFSTQYEWVCRPWCLPGPQIHAQIGKSGPKQPHYEIRVM